MRWVSLLALAAALPVPGLGHVLAGDRARGGLITLIISLTFGTGILLHGELPKFQPEAPLTLVAEITSRATGVLDFTCRRIGIGWGDQLLSHFEIGNVYILCSGTMNLLAFFDLLNRLNSRKK